MKVLLTMRHAGLPTNVLRFLTVTALIWLTAQAQAQTPRLHAATRIAVPPVVDGDLSDACWQGANWMECFERVNTSSGTPTAGTRARFCFDQDALYVAVECLEPDMPALRERISRNQAVLFSEGIEIFLDEGRDMTAYHHFAVAVTGARYEGLAMDESWKCDWKSAVKLSGAGYTMELAIPFSSLAVPVPGSSDVWGMNVCRTRSVSAPPEFSAWSRTPGGFHNPAYFGALAFSSYSEWLSGFNDAKAGATATKMRALCEKYPASTAREKSLVDEVLTKRATYRAGLPSSLSTEAEARPWYERGTQQLNDMNELDQRLRLAIIANEFR